MYLIDLIKGEKTDYRAKLNWDGYLLDNRHWYLWGNDEVFGEADKLVDFVDTYAWKLGSITYNSNKYFNLLCLCDGTTALEINLDEEYEILNKLIQDTYKVSSREADDYDWDSKDIKNYISKYLGNDYSVSINYYDNILEIECENTNVKEVYPDTFYNIHITHEEDICGIPIVLVDNKALCFNSENDPYDIEVELEKE